MGGSTLLLFFANASIEIPAESGDAGAVQQIGMFGWQFFFTGSTPALTFPEALVAAIRADATLDSLIAGRIYPGHLPETFVYPAVVMKINKPIYGQDLDGYDGTADARVEFVASDYDYLVTCEIVKALGDLFNPMIRETLSGVLILAAIVEDDGDDYLWSNDGSDEGTFTDGLRVTFKYET